MSAAVVKYLQEKQLGRGRGSFHLTVPGCSSAMVGKTQQQEPKTLVTRQPQPKTPGHMIATAQDTWSHDSHNSKQRKCIHTGSLAQVQNHCLGNVATPNGLGLLLFIELRYYTSQKIPQSTQGRQALVDSLFLDC